MREKLNVTFRALRSRNFRLFLFGQGISNMGTWMQRVALSWLVYELTSSALLLGLVNFASYIPLLIISPIAGVWIDRYPKIKIVIATQILSMIQAFILAFLVLSGKIEIWHVIVLSLFLGVINAFDVPGRQSSYINLIDNKEDLPNAIALNSVAFHLSRFIGPSIAGIIIAAFSEGISFLVNGFSYIPVIISLFMIRVDEEPKKGEEKHASEELKDGFRYISARPGLKNILLLVGAISLFGWSYTILFPIFAKDILGGDALTFGFLNSAAAIGAIVGAFYAASRKDLFGLERRAVFFASIFGVALVLFSFSKMIWFSIFFVALSGLGAMLHNTSANSYVQSVVSGERRGRVMSFYALAHQGLIPIGSLLLGWAASSYGAPAAMIAAGIFCILSVLLLGPRIVASYSK
ncbi:hypothetical protein A3I27_02925 [Candidatus Giovannonibacteria bacterium RIFCSPLOWO2_02_FULL_43_11b]|uniref:Major facilitator superfamily (MFS) profile domain-containing protein n=1 Tax=Candidatus Giovannonibacteria bacterium RIFCSPHIGHO2_12_FULL_43_15 TaxID=1798341 RepID=A0A1F5WR01_9BACT|nr:MAG: hypothetical protein A3F23_02735 [Candidatus Giovannonibacteria bacterium RIFCSPHIGHO2_12_FULL_43_15]OGF89162.1 MAG: hypothetical protein A3I27_02925 [Candidatus Giovannonibacteria bacterium RIFCSPLOWO2_02_FULL_43_11b]OGF92346.1 MAG: hypothetical protein A3H04_01275 [Candidatus Giovannonibacteria bacterium RIFCSPLOWO2_12_FULL_43_11c]